MARGSKKSRALRALIILLTIELIIMTQKFQNADNIVGTSHHLIGPFTGAALKGANSKVRGDEGAKIRARFLR